MERSDIYLVSLSPKASSFPSSGHYFWLYHHLQLTQAATGKVKGVTIAPKGVSGKFLLPILSPQKSLFSWAGFSFIRYRHRQVRKEIRRLQKSGVNAIQFYDGGLTELIVAMSIAKKLPNLTVIYNFHWAIQWVDLFRADRRLALALAQEIRRLVGIRPKNLVISAETPRFGKELSRELGFSVPTYPIISTLTFEGSPSWANRMLDVLILPQGAEEFRYALEFADQLRADGLVCKIFVGQKTLADFKQESRSFAVSDDQLIVGPLEQHDYGTMLSSARVALLPYRKEYFRWGSSGKLIEAISAGTFPFVPSETAIPGQSSLPEHIHHFQMEDIFSSISTIKMRLTEGWPDGLHSKDASFLLRWISDHAQFDSPEVKIATFRLVRVVILSLFYRERTGPWWVALRGALGDRYDAFRRSAVLPSTPDGNSKPN
jgi:hypothetical protein